MTIAFWCVFIAGILPYVPFGFASSKLNRKAPRLGAGALDGLAARAYGAHLNAFEAFPYFAAAVLVAHAVEGPSVLVNWLAVLFIVARIAHVTFYLTDRPPLRSTSFFIGAGLSAIIFIQTAFH
jgi:uncharacterized MAPEG superfamily protein